VFGHDDATTEALEVEQEPPHAQAQTKTWKQAGEKNPTN